MARRILALEGEVRDLLRRIPASKAILDLPADRRGRTRAAAVDRLAAALDATVSAADRPLLSQARARWTEAQDLRWRLALSATRVAWREARRMAGNPSLARADLVQEGMLGLLDAAKRFEPDKGIRFGTYARWWVRASMTRAIDVARIVHLSVGACEQLRNLRKEITSHESAGETWTTKELADAVGIDVARATTLLGVGTGTSLDDGGGDDDAAPALQLADDSRPAPDECASRQQDLEWLHATVCAELPERHRHIVTSRYGIGREAKTLVDIARGMKLSRERVRQLEQDSLRRLREAGQRLARTPARA